MFRTRYGYFEYYVISFGLFNTQASFQGYINKILAKKFDIFIIMYQNDILLYTEDPGQPHIDAICPVLEKLWRHDFLPNVKIVSFLLGQSLLLGICGISIRYQHGRKKNLGSQDMAKVKVYEG